MNFISRAFRGRPRDQGQAGRLNVFKEARPRGGGYWYAYHSHQGQARKRYLGRTATLTLARLEAVAQALARAALW